MKIKIWDEFFLFKCINIYVYTKFEENRNRKSWWKVDFYWKNQLFWHKMLNIFWFCTQRIISTKYFLKVDSETYFLSHIPKKSESWNLLKSRLPCCKSKNGNPRVDQNFYFYFYKKVLVIYCHNQKTDCKKIAPSKSYEFLKKSYFNMSKHRLLSNFF